jgi:hypothetical protein
MNTKTFKLRISIISVMVAVFALVPLPIKVVEAAPLVTDCSYTCKAWKEWDGGAKGGQVRQDVNRNLDCFYPSCSYAEILTLAKNRTNVGCFDTTCINEYRVAGQHRSAYTYEYYWGEYSPSEGYTYHPFVGVDADDYSVTIVIQYFDNSGWDMGVYIDNHIYGCEEYHGQAFYTQNTTLVDDLQTGFRVNSPAGHKVVVPNFTTDHHKWECGCNNTWYYQTSNADPYNQAPDWLLSQWQQSPSVSSIGGIYQGFCSCP